MWGRMRSSFRRGLVCPFRSPTCDPLPVSPLQFAPSSVVLRAGLCHHAGVPPRAFRAALTVGTALFSLAFLGSCTRKPPPEAAPKHAVGALAFHEDHYEQALAEARRRDVPLFVDAWAPWCHTCLSLRSYVLAAPAMAPLADRFVWLSLDTERESNRAFLARFPVLVWPTLWVIDPRTERPLLRWPGSLNGDELRQLLDDTTLAYRNNGKQGDSAAALVLAERAVAEGKIPEAVDHFRTAIAQAPEGWPRRGRAADGLVTALYNAQRHGECAEAARAEQKKAGSGTSAANVALYGLLCARKVGEKERIEEAARSVEAIAKDPAQQLLPDDRSSLYEELVDLRKDQGEKEAARAVAETWSSYLDAQAKESKDAAGRRVFDAHRMVAYLELSQHEKALAMVKQSAEEQPEDYNHPARLAKIHLVAGHTEQALVEIDRSLKLGYGPRRLRLFDLKARIQEKQGDPAGMKATLEQGIREGEAMKLEGKETRALDALKARMPR